MKYVLLSVFVASLVGCIEVRDKNELSPVVGTLSNQRHRTVTEPLFVHKGQLLNAQDYEAVAQSKALWERGDYTIDFDQLTLKSGGQIFTMGHNVRLRIKDLFSEGGLISTFPKGFQALSGDGRSGGHLVIAVDKAQGFLNVQVRGENGAKGEDGAAPGSELDGMLRIVVPGNANFSSTSKPPKKGNSGRDGFKGGDSGTLSLEVLISNNFSYAVERTFGVGGAFGRGGLGGKFGDIVLNKPEEKTRRAQRGDDGKPGVNGVNQDICIEINKVRVCS